MNICFTGGGTAGHIFPALQVDHAMQSRLSASGQPYQRFWIGSKDEHEQSWVQSASIDFYPISTGKLRRYVSVKNLTDIGKVILGCIQAFFILRKLRPDVVFSKGGFVSVPVVFAAWLLRIPSITHESDASLGLATRINSLFSKRLCVSFPEVGSSCKPSIKKNMVVTGTPVRFAKEQTDAFRGRTFLSIDDKRPLIVVLGGSQGALQINNLVWDHLGELTSLGYVFHQTGSSTYKPIEYPGYVAKAFVEEHLEDIIAAATVVVSRAGATALGEFIELEKPMLLIPLGSGASRGDQYANAVRLEREQAAIVLRETSDSSFMDSLRSLLFNSDKRDDMIANCKRLKTIDSEGRIVDQILLSMER